MALSRKSQPSNHPSTFDGVEPQVSTWQPSHLWPVTIRPIVQLAVAAAIALGDFHLIIA